MKAAEDADAADDVVTLTHTAGGGDYAGLTASLAVTVDDDETAAIVLSANSLAVDEGDASGETYTVKLSHVPTAPVTVTVSGHAGSDVSLDKTSLAFTTSNWNTAQTVTVTAAEDADTAGRLRHAHPHRRRRRLRRTPPPPSRSPSTTRRTSASVLTGPPTQPRREARAPP